MGRQRGSRGKNPRQAVNVQGREWIPYGGILDIAHQKGLVGIDTELIQIPSKDNGNVAIVKATAVQKKDNNLRHWSGIGDASPENVGAKIVPHIIRQAETRAKARALGDMVNRANVDETYEDDVGANVAPMRGAAQRLAEAVDETIAAEHSSAMTPKARGDNVVRLKSNREAADFVEKNKPENPGESGGGATTEELEELRVKINAYQLASGHVPNLVAWEERNLPEGKSIDDLTSDEVGQYVFILENLIEFKGGDAV